LFGKESKYKWREDPVADSEQSQAKKKRRLRAPSETVRERAVKAQEAAADPKPTKRRLVFSGFTLPLRLIWRGLAWLAHKPPLKPIGHGLRWFFTRRPLKFIGKLLGFKFIAGSFKEVKLVSWPTFRQSMRLTKAVIIFSIIFGSLIAGVDYGLDKLFKQIILK
jgi:preprotein translocase SecE subunit